MYLLMVLAQVQQTDVLFGGPVPADVPTFEVRDGRSDPFYAGVKVDGNWLRDSNAELAPTTKLELYPDIPWQGQEVYSRLKRGVELKYETPVMRRERLRRVWTDYGYTFIETSAGWRPVLQDDANYSERARQLIAKAETRQAALAASAPPDALASEKTGSSAGGRGGLLAAALGVLVVGGVLLAVIVKVMVLPGEEPWKPVA